MSALIGYRSVIFNLIMGLTSIVGLQLDPAVAVHVAGILVVLWMTGGVLLHFVTQNPAIAHNHPEVVKVATEIANDIAEIIPAAPVDNSGIPTPQAPANGAATITGPPDIIALATSVTNALAVAQQAFDTVHGQLLSAHATVSAALPPVLAPADPVPAIPSTPSTET